MAWGLDAGEGVHATVTNAMMAEPDKIGPQPVLGCFGDYDLEEEIARGGMGVVYRARQRGLNRVVAVKMILAGHFSGPDALQRFRAEATSAARLRHPNIVGIHEVGERNGFHYFSMDLVEGHDMGQRLREGPVGQRSAADWVRTIALAIQHAHDQGVLHRDLKPSNILLDHAGVPFVTDFGLAREMDGGSDMTVSGQVLGSPNYMPPEQAEGRRDDVGRASDVYALGAILYHLLTGRPPFVGGTLAETLRRVVNDEPASPRLLNSQLSEDLETICLKCLEKEPRRRMQSARELADELGRFLLDEPIRARPISRLERTVRWCRRRPAIAGLWAALAGVTMIGAVVVVWQLLALRASNAESRRQIVSLNNRTGVDLMQGGDWFKSLLWYAAALRDAGPAETAAARTRFASLLEASPRLAMCLAHEGEPLSAFAWSPVDDSVATAGADRCIWVWNALAGTRIARSEPLPASPSRVVFSPNGKQLLVTLTDATVLLLNAADGGRLTPPINHRLDGTPRTELHATFDSSGRFLLTQPVPRTLQVIDTATGNACGRPLVHPADLQWMQFGVAGSRVLVRVADNVNYLWDWQQGLRLPWPWPAEAGMPRFFTDASGDLALAGSRLWNLANGKRGAEIGESWPTWVAFNRAGSQLATGNGGAQVSVWDIESGRRLSGPFENRSPVWGGEFSPDGSILITQSPDLLLRGRMLDTGEPAFPPLVGLGRGLGSFSASGRFVAVLTQQRLAQVWDLGRSKSSELALRPLRGHNAVQRSSLTGGEVRHPSGALIHFASPTTGSNVSLHASSVQLGTRQVWLHDSGKYILTEYAHRRVQVWDPESGLPLTPLLHGRYELDEAKLTSLELPSIALPVDALARMAELLSGFRLDGSGGWTPLDREHLLEHWQELVRIYPEHFGARDRDLAAWHRAEAELAEGAFEWEAAVFHWDRLRVLEPSQPGWEKRWDYAERCVKEVATSRVPPRADLAPAVCLDLTRQYTSPLQELGLPSFRNLGYGCGLQIFGGIPFDLRGAIRLRGQRLERTGTRLLGEVRGIPVGRTATKLHWLHAAEWVEEADKGEVAQLRIWYADGAAQSVPVRLNEHVASMDLGRIDPAKGPVAWLGLPRWGGLQARPRNLQWMSWTNSRPTTPISHLDIVAADTLPNYVLLAITIQE